MKTIKIYILLSISFSALKAQYTPVFTNVRGGRVSISLSSDGNTLAAGGDYGLVLSTFSGSSWGESLELDFLASSSPIKFGNAVSLSGDGKTLAVGSCLDSLNKGAVLTYTLTGLGWKQIGNKLVAKGSKAGDQQGYSVSLSFDGKLLAVGAKNDSNYVGAVWTYSFTGGNWQQFGKKVVGTQGFGYQGSSVCLSGDGKTLAEGGISDGYHGATWVFTLTGNNWTQVGSKLVGTNETSTYPPDQGYSVSLSFDGKTLAVGGPGQSEGIGAVWMFEFRSGNWTQNGNYLQGYDYIGVYRISVYQGHSVSLSSDGNTLAVGGQEDNHGVGATWIFKRKNGIWRQFGNKLVASGGIYRAFQGYSVSLSSDANTLAVSELNGRNIIFKNNVLTNFKENDLQNQFIYIYPNPFSNSFKINFEDEYTYSIQNLEGKSFENGDKNSADMGKNLLPGIYLINIKSNSRSVFEKIIKY